MSMADQLAGNQLENVLGVPVMRKRVLLLYIEVFSPQFAL